MNSNKDGTAYKYFVSVNALSDEQMNDFKLQGWRLLKKWQSGNDWHYKFLKKYTKPMPIFDSKVVYE